MLLLGFKDGARITLTETAEVKSALTPTNVARLFCPLVLADGSVHNVGHVLVVSERWMHAAMQGKAYECDIK